MKAIKIVCLLIDHDELGVEQCLTEINNARYHNHWIGPQVMSHEAVDIGEWDDDHPSNTSEREEWFAKAFK
jgi:hypothetical protein